MNLNEAIQGWREFAAIKFNQRTAAHSLECVETILAALRACQREKREMFAKLSPSCSGRYPISETCKWCRGMTVCTLRNCPLLKGGAK